MHEELKTKLIDKKSRILFDFEILYNKAVETQQKKILSSFLISKRNDGMWILKDKNSQKTIRLFATKSLAQSYIKKPNDFDVSNFIKEQRKQIEAIENDNNRICKAREQARFEDYLERKAKEIEIERQQERQQEAIERNKTAADNLCRSCKNFYCLNRFKLSQPICSMFEPTFKR